MKIAVITYAVATLSLASALSSTRGTSTRRVALENWGTIAAASAFMVATPSVAFAAEDNVALSEEEMAARVARKMAILNARKNGASAGTPPVSAMDIRSDINPEAGTNLRSRTALENAQIAQKKMQELKTRDKAQKREDLCEMLGRGC